MVKTKDQQRSWCKKDHIELHEIMCATDIVEPGGTEALYPELSQQSVLYKMLPRRCNKIHSGVEKNKGHEFHTFLEATKAHIATIVEKKQLNGTIMSHLIGQSQPRRGTIQILITILKFTLLFFSAIFTLCI